MLYFIKILYTFIIPPGSIILALIVFNVYLFKRKYRSAYFLSAIIAIFWLLSTNYIAFFLVKPLENQYKNPTISELKQGAYDSIIMLGGGAINVEDIGGDGQVSGYVANRMLTVYRLHKNLDLPIILSGGKVFEDTGREADIEKRIFSDMGIRDQDLLLENQSRNTIENVKYTKVIMEENGLQNPIVVTSGFHIPRAILIFEQENIPVKAYVSDYQISDNISWSIFNLLPNNQSLNISCVAIREYLGILALKLRLQ